MCIFDILIPNHSHLTNCEILRFKRQINIPYFRTACMLNTLLAKVKYNEFCVVNINKSGEKGSHWVTYWKNERQEFISILIVKSLP